MTRWKNHLLLRGKQRWCHQRIAVLHGTALPARCTRLASGTAAAEGRMCACRSPLRREGLCHREARRAVFYIQPAHCIDPVQLGKSRKRAQEHRICQRPHGRDACQGGAGDNRRPDARALEEHLTVQFFYLIIGLIRPIGPIRPISHKN